MNELDYVELKILYDTVCMENDRLRAALEEVEWIFDDRDGIVCPWCHGKKYHSGHNPDCQRKVALGIAEEK